MGHLLHAIGAFAARRRWTVIGVWVLMVVVVGAAAAAFKTPPTDSFSIPGTQSIDTLNQLQQEFPSQEGTAGKVVIAAPDGKVLTDPTYQAAITESVANLSALENVTSAVDPFTAKTVSPKGNIAYISMQYSLAQADLPVTTADDARTASKPMIDAGLQVEFSGQAYIVQAPPSSPGEIIGIFVAIIVLLVTLRAFVAAMLPFVTSIAAVGLGLASVYALSGTVEMSSTAPILALMLGLAVGIDYSLFILSRHRAQLVAGMSVRDSIARANGTAGAAVVFAGATVVVALVALFMAGIPFLTVMGIAAAGTVALAVVAALTLLPAVLSFAGLKVLPRKQRALVGADTYQPAATEPKVNRWVQAVTSKPWLVLVAGIAILGVMAIPATQLRLGLPTEASQPAESSAKKGYDLLAEGFGAGFNGPIVVLSQTTDTATGAADATALATEFGTLGNVAFVSPPQPNADGTAYVLTVIPSTAPDSKETEQLVHDMRAVEPVGSSTFGVTGTTAIQIDVAEGIASALPGYLLVVVGLALVLLLVVFRSVLIPIKALLGFLLTLAATAGALVAVFQWGWFDSLLGVHYTGPIVAFLPIIAIGITFGLAMDYEVFLVSRMREEHLAGAEDKTAIRVGFSHSARVVTAAAFIMSSVFLGFMLGDDAIIKSIGFALAFAVLIDAFVVRMTLVPAAMAVMGKAAWWLPKWLQRIVPEIHIEGDPEEAEPTATEPKELADA